MSEPQGTARKRSGPGRRDGEASENSAEVERLARELTDELRNENAALRQENAHLRRSAENYHVLSDSVDEGFCILEAIPGADGGPVDYRFLETNRAFARRTGIHDAAGKRMRELVPDCEEHWFDVCGAVAATGEPGHFIDAATPFTGGWRDISVFPVGGPGGNRVAVLLSDVAGREKAEEELRESREKLRTLFQFLPVGVSILDENGKVLDVNPALGDILDLSRDDLLHGVYKHRRYLRPDGTGMPAAEFASSRALAEERAVRNVEIGVEKEDGGIIWTSVSAVPLPFSDWRTLMTTSDISKRKRAEEALQRRTEELARLHRDLQIANREANLYLDILTHDIGNTENVSNLYADLLIESLEGKAADQAKNLQRSIQKSIEILGTVSTIRRIHRAPSDLRPMDLDAVVRGVVADFAGSTVRYDGVHYPVMADDLLSVVFENLIGNAVKFGGPDVEIAVRAEEEDGFVRVTVEDTGPGVPDSEKDAIFHRYEQQKRGVGEGLGLYLVQILVERYGGEVLVDDRVPGSPEEGAAFTFTLRAAA